MEVTPTLGKGTLGSWSFHRSTGGRTQCRHISLALEMELGPGQTNRSRGACESALQPRFAWEGSRKNLAKTPNRTWENRLSGIIGGPPETWPWWKCDPASQSKER